MTQSISRPSAFAITSIALCALMACAAGTFPLKARAQAAGQREPITLNFVNAEIEAVARTMATLTGRNVVVDPRVKGTMTLSTERPVAPSVAYDQFLATLRVQGFTVVQSGGLDKIVPEADAKLQGGPETVSSDGLRGVAGNQIVTQIFKLNYENAANLVPVLRPLISPNNTINVNPGNNSLVITDYADNLRRIGRIVASMDVSNATDLEIIPLQYTVATDLVPLVTRLVDPSSSAGGGAPGVGQADTSFKTTIMAEPRSNALIVRAANPARLALVRGLVARLDQPAAMVPGGLNNASGNIHVVYLKNADATKLAVTLRAAISGEARGGGGSTSSSGGGLSVNNSALSGSNPGMNTSSSSSGGLSTSGSLNSANSNQPSTGGQIQADPSTNSLIITAPEPQYRQLRAVIDQLDGRRAQVLVESLIVEVNASKAAQFGIQWQGLLGSGNNVGILGTNFSTGGTANIIDLALTAAGATSSTSSTTSTTLPSTGGNFGIGHKTGGVYVLGFLANFLQTNGDGNVLSTPNLLTLDNEEAKIVIGENVPFPTGSYTNNNSSSGSVNPFTTVERKDVGLTLKIRPQINENGTVKLVIFQETSNVKSGTELAANGPTTTKRSIESTVLVDDGSVVVIGGLLQDQYAGNQDKVPIVGDVPFFGNLFKSETRSRSKTNLMVFLRPVVVRDARETEAMSMDRYDLIRGMQRDAQPVQSKMIPVNEAPILAPIINPNLPAKPKDVPPQPLGQSSDSVAPGMPLQTLPTR